MIRNATIDDLEEVTAVEDAKKQGRLGVVLI